MKAFEDDGIDLMKLNQGKHLLNWQLQSSFFEAFEGSLIQEGTINAALELERADRVFRAELSVQGEVNSTCDNCLESIPVQIKNSLQFVVKLSEVPVEDDMDNEVYYVQSSDPRFY
ncbi:MAG: hypothetical protein LPK45_11000, partial [Bacteroidota bacterium]|nr:hypothetical protein [Bacteroidota bacterium]MDX5431629.1 hypothetical protein [Bacteroidota bacterium]MDX5470347.1 hypothetical protein [Bacteroidota bacterium]